MGVVFLFDVPVFVAYVIVVTAGFAFAFSAKILAIAMMTFIQMETPVELGGKVLSVLMVVPFVAQALGYPLQGRLFGQFAASPWVVVLGVALATLVVAMFAWGYFRRALGERQ